MNDTPSEIARLVRERLMARSGVERFRMGVAMFEVARTPALASFARGLSEQAWRRRLFERFYGMPCLP